MIRSSYKLNQLVHPVLRIAFEVILKNSDNYKDNQDKDSNNNNG